VTTLVKSEYSYREFCEYARYFNQADLLAAIARTATALPDDWITKPDFRRTPPWTLAALAKASIVHGNRHGSTPVRPGTVPFGCAIYSNPTREELKIADSDPVFNLLVRTAYQQFPYQESRYEELARAEALFDGYSGRKQLEVVNEAAVIELFGAPVREAVGAAFILWASTMLNGGVFDPAWLGQEPFSAVLQEVPREHVESVINTSFVTDLDGFKQMAASAPVLPGLERYMFNPLTARPLLRLDDGRLLAPVPQLILHRLSPIEQYYEGVRRLGWGEAFTRDLGELFEDYVGRQLGTLPGATVHAEISYGGKRKNEKKSVDWIVVFDDLVLLVDAKATRLAAGPRAGDEETKARVSKALSRGFEQIDRTHQLILDRADGFSHLPTDRPFVGLVATLDPWYITNSGLARDFLHQPRIPSLVGSARSIETLVAIGQRRPASETLKLISGDSEMSTWDLDTSLARFAEPTDNNPILDAAWDTFPFNPSLAAARSSG